MAVVGPEKVAEKPPGKPVEPVEPAGESGRWPRRRRLARRVALAAVTLVLLAAVGSYLNLNRVARQKVEEQTTRAINLRTTVVSVAVHPWAGEVGFTDFRIASPPGFATPDMLIVPSADMRVSLGQLRNEPVHITSVTLDHPRLVIEADETASLNLRRMVERIPRPPHPIHLVIDEVTVRDATVVLRNLPGAPGERSVPVATFTVKNLGADQPGGALIKDVVTRLVTTLAVQASDSPQMPHQYRALIKGDIGSIVRGAIPGEMGRLLSGMLGGGSHGSNGSGNSGGPGGPTPSGAPSAVGGFGTLLGKMHPTSRPE